MKLSNIPESFDFADINEYFDEFRTERDDVFMSVIVHDHLGVIAVYYDEDLEGSVVDAVMDLTDDEGTDDNLAYTILFTVSR